MSDLIDFKTLSGPSPTMASPLIPVPKEAGARSGGESRDNPFDIVFTEIAEYERNKEDPFECAIEKAKNQVKIFPDISIIHSTAEADLSILHQSFMNDSLLDGNYKSPSVPIESLLSPQSLAVRKFRRSVSATDAPPEKQTLNKSGSTHSSASSLVSQNPLNLGFRKGSCSSTDSPWSSLVTCQKRDQSDLSKCSVLSSISNISSISSNPSSFASNSASSGIMNKGLLESQLKLDSSKSGLKISPDLIDRFMKIKSRVSSQFSISSENRSSNSTSVESRKSGEKLIDVSDASTMIKNETFIPELVSQEVKLLAETFEQLAYDKSPDHSDVENIQINFDQLPPSDDEAEVVDNLIELPPSPCVNPNKKQSKTETSESKENVAPQPDIKQLESELLSPDDLEKKATAASVLLDLEKLVKDVQNPKALSMLRDLQKMLGVESNSDILKACLTDSKKAQKDDLKESEGETSANSLSEESSTTDLVEVLQKLVSNKDESFAKKIVKNFGNALAADINLKCKDKINDKVSHVKNRLSNHIPEPSTPKSRLNKSINGRSLTQTPQSVNRSLRANTPINKISGNIASKVLFSKCTPRANLLDIKKRIPSEPSFNKNANEITPNQDTGSVTSQMKNKLKTQNTSTILAKKGPMKAVIPLGNMQKQGNSSRKASPAKITPPRHSRVPLGSGILMSSTPNLSNKKSPKNKPNASSTPALNRSRLQYPKSFVKPAIVEKDSLDCDLSPVLLTPDRKPNSETFKLSASKQCSPPRRSMANGESRLPRYSPRPAKTRVSSLDKSKSSGLKCSFSKSSSLQDNRFNSPLRDVNKLTPSLKKVSRSLNTMTIKGRLGRAFEGLELEKENLA